MSIIPLARRAAIRPIGRDVQMFELWPLQLLNCYLIGDVLIDAGTRGSGRALLRALRGSTVRGHALTHAHPDHQGSSHEVCQALGIPLWCGAGDAEAVEDPRLIEERLPAWWLTKLIGPRWVGPPHPVARRLSDGDRVGGFTVLETPGHSAGHIAFWRPADRVLVIGDAARNRDYLSGAVGLHEPPRVFTIDPRRNRESLRRLAALGPEVVCFGHGPPLRDPARFRRFVEGLPRD